MSQLIGLCIPKLADCCSLCHNKTSLSGASMLIGMSLSIVIVTKNRFWDLLNNTHVISLCVTCLFIYLYIINIYVSIYINCTTLDFIY